MEVCLYGPHGVNALPVVTKSGICPIDFKCSYSQKNIRTRKCNSPYAMLGGKDCEGHLYEDTANNSCYGNDCCPG